MKKIFHFGNNDVGSMGSVSIIEKQHHKGDICNRIISQLKTFVLIGYLPDSCVNAR